MGLSDLLQPRRRLVKQAAELAALRKEVAALKAQNESMRQGMRRCVTCEYRIDFKQRQDQESS